MEPLTILLWAGVWIAYLFVQSIVINGIKIAADGESELLPDGTWKHSEMIFNPLQRFLLQSKMVKVFYKEEHFDRLYETLLAKKVLLPSFKKLGYNVVFFPEGEGPFSPDLLDATKDTIERSLSLISKERGEGWKFQIFLMDAAKFDVIFFKEYEKYKFSKWIRKPIIQCIKCMSSFWSLVLTFVPPVIIVFGLSWWIIPAWAINVLSLTYINNLIYKK